MGTFDLLFESTTSSHLLVVHQPQFIHYEICTCPHCSCRIGFSRQPQLKVVGVLANSTQVHSITLKVLSKTLVKQTYDWPQKKQLAGLVESASSLFNAETI